MSRFRQSLPQWSERLFLTDGGIETTLIHHDGIELPSFAAFVLLEQERGIQALARYYRRYADLAVRYGTGLVLESPTWRANPDWARRLGYSRATLADVNRRGMALIAGLANGLGLRRQPTLLSGNIGPRCDGYVPSDRMSPSEAAAYHAEQIAVFSGTEADLVSAFTINYVEEAMGIAAAARMLAMPAVISFTVETDGRLPDGATLASAIERTDDASGGHPAYYMINCAHPSHFAREFDSGSAWHSRVRGIRANASRMSHTQLNESQTLDEGDPEELGAAYAELRRKLPSLSVFGGCCGTDHRHVEAMIRAVRQDRRAA